MDPVPRPPSCESWAIYVATLERTRRSHAADLVAATTPMGVPKDVATARREAATHALAAVDALLVEARRMAELEEEEMVRMRNLSPDVHDLVLHALADGPEVARTGAKR